MLAPGKAEVVCRLSSGEGRGDVVGINLQVNLLDSGEARKCLTGKYMVMLGDSTMTETMHDLVLLLSGLGADHDAMQAYMANATRSALSLTSSARFVAGYEARVRKLLTSIWASAGLLQQPETGDILNTRVMSVWQSQARRSAAFTDLGSHQGAAAY